MVSYDLLLFYRSKIEPRLEEQIPCHSLIFPRDHLRFPSVIIWGSKSFAVQFRYHFRSGGPTLFMKRVIIRWEINEFTSRADSYPVVSYCLIGMRGLRDDWGWVSFQSTLIKVSWLHVTATTLYRSPEGNDVIDSVNKYVPRPRQSF